MPYPPQLVDPMRKELTSLGVNELLTPDEVDQAMHDASGKTTLVVVNSVCGCAAANARPAVRLAMHADKKKRLFFSHWNTAQGEWVASGFDPEVRNSMPRGEQ